MIESDGTKTGSPLFGFELLSSCVVERFRCKTALLHLFLEETDCDVKMKLGIKSVVNLIGG